MNLPRSIRILIAMAVLVLGLAALLLLLTISEATLNIQAHLDRASPLLRVGWWSLVGIVGLALTWLLWRILRPRPARPDKPATSTAPPDAAQVDAAIARADELGIDTVDARRELQELTRRREAGEIHVALYGEISTGKSALVQALLPDAQIASDARGGTTRELKRYAWTSDGGDTLLITDMPGAGEVDGGLDRLASDEAIRAHIVIYVTDGDINRAQHEALQSLLQLDKPLILALNKTDRYRDEEITLLSDRLRSLIKDHPSAELVQVSAAGSREITRIEADGQEHVERQLIAPRVTPLVQALQRQIDGRQEILDRLRDSATFVLASRQLDHAIATARHEKAEQLVESYSRKAVVGAVAAITPGSDLLIQGFLGTQMVRELGELYDTQVRKVDTDLLLKLVQQHVGKAHTLLLAVAGNALKAFPGIGTLAGGALHAVAYGIIFRTLGRALATTLATRGELHPRQTAKLFEERLGENLDTSARGLARLVIEQSRTQRDNDDQH